MTKMLMERYNTYFNAKGLMSVNKVES